MDDQTDEDMMELIQAKGKCLEGFKREYLELKKQHDLLEASLMGKERELESYNAEIQSVRDQISFIHRNVDEVAASQQALKDAADHMNTRRSQLIDREMTNREQISVFTGYFKELEATLAIGPDWTPEQLEEKQGLVKQNDFLTGKYEGVMMNLNGIRQEIDRIYETIQDLEKENTEKDQRVAEIVLKTKEFRAKTKSMIAHREEREQMVFQLREAIIKAESDLVDRRRQYTGEDRTLHDLEANLAATKEQMEVYLSEYDLLYRSLQEFSSELERQKNHNRKVEEEISEKTNQLGEKKKDVEHFSKEAQKLIQMRELAKGKIKEVEEEKRAAEDRRDSLSADIQTVASVEIVAVNKQIESSDNQLSSYRRELEIIRKKEAGSEKATRTMQDLIQLNINGKKNLRVEQKTLEEEVRHQKDQIRLLLQEKERYEHDAEIMNQQYYTGLEELKLQELQVQELQKKMLEDQGKLKHKQNLYEAVRSDRNLYSKQLIDSQEEINSLRRKFRGMNHLIEQLKDEISVKDHQIVKEHFLHHSVDKEKELLKNELMKVRKQVVSSEGIIDNQRVEILKLTRIIDEAEQERGRQRNELAAVISERNLLTSQVVKRNYELGTMYERIKLQRSNLRIGESNYNRVMDGIGSWKSQLVQVVKDQKATIADLTGLEDLRNKVIRLEKELLTEQTKSRALCDEMERPMNVHRWRVLESSDPKRYEKIVQIQALQQQLVAKSDEVIRCDLLIQEKEKVYVELKNIISRQPGPEVEEQILVYQQTLKDKVKQLHAMDEELDMYRQQVSKFKEEIAEFDGEISKIKKKWFKVQRGQNPGGNSRTQ